MPSPTRDMNYLAVELVMDALGTPKTRFVVSPCDGKIVYMASVVDTAVTVADAVMTGAIQGVNITGGVITHPTAGSVAGQVVAAIPTALNVVKRGQNINFTVAAGPGAGQARLTIVIDQQGF